VVVLGGDAFFNEGGTPVAFTTPTPPPPGGHASMAHIRQSRPDSGLGIKTKVLKTVRVVAPSLGSVSGLQRRD